MNLKYQVGDYTLNFKNVTCTCLDFKHRRSKFLKEEKDRCCKHFQQFFVENVNEIKVILESGGVIPIDYIPLQWIHLLNSKAKPKVPIQQALNVMNKRIQPHIDDLVLNFSIDKFNYCGSFRRWLDCDVIPSTATVGDIDVIYMGSAEIETIVSMINPEEIMAIGKKKSMMMVSGVHVDIRKIDKEEQYVFLLLRNTGSKAENIRLSKIALSLGYSLNDYGIYNLNKKGEKAEHIFNTEEDIYKFLGEPYRRPRERNPELVIKYYIPQESYTKIVKEVKQPTKPIVIKKRYDF